MLIDACYYMPNWPYQRQCDPILYWVEDRDVPILGGWDDFEWTQGHARRASAWDELQTWPDEILLN